MKLEHWQLIFKAHQQVRSLLDQWLPAEGLPGARAMVKVGQRGLSQLQEQLLGVVVNLTEGLGAAYGVEEVESAQRPFVYLVDELVLRRLAEGDQPNWRLLQYHLFGEDSGGDLFYELADAKLLRPDPSPLVYEMFYFCLTAGFGGRHLGNHAKLREYRERLAALIPRPELVTAPPRGDAKEAPLLYEFPFRYYVATGFFVLALPVVLWWLSH